jgi:hypothetical protein
MPPGRTLCRWFRRNTNRSRRPGAEHATKHFFIGWLCFLLLALAHTPTYHIRIAFSARIAKPNFLHTSTTLILTHTHRAQSQLKLSTTSIERSARVRHQHGA